MENYYVTMIDYGRVWKLAGPYQTHQEALNKVDKAKQLAIENDRKNHFKAFGTSKIATNELGILNKAGLI